MAIGAFAGGSAGDRWGRRPALLASTALFGAATLAAAIASRLEWLVFWRLITGIGLGGALPNATALMAEFVPPHRRSQAITATIVGVPIGGMLGAAIAAEVVPAFGWRALFVIGAVLPLLSMAVMYFVLPEPARFLATRTDRQREFAVLVGRIEPGTAYSCVQNFVLSAPAKVQSTGVGWALGAGRLGGILSSFAGALLLAHGGGQRFFGGIALVLVLTFGSVVVIRRHIPGATAREPVQRAGTRQP